MNTREMKKPRPVLTHRRGQILNPTTQLENLVEERTALLNPPEPSRRPDCPAWCFGHHPDDDEPGPCTPTFYDWVDFAGDSVTVTVSQNVGEQPRVCLFPGDSDQRGVRLPDAEADKLISLLISARRVIDPAYSPSAVLHLIEAA